MKESIWQFRIGDVLPSSDALARFVTVIGAALNDLLFVNQLLVGPEHTSAGERQYLFRTASAHLCELSRTLAQWRDHEAVRSLIEGLSQDARADLDAVLRIAVPGDDPVLKTMRHLRDKATWHYADPEHQKWIERALKTAADHVGDFQFGTTVGTIRAGFVDEILLQFSIQLFPGADEEAEVAAFRLFLQQVADLMTAAIRVASDLLALFFAARKDAINFGDARG